MFGLIQKKLSQFSSDSFWKNNAVFFFGSLFAGALNYLYYPILSRLMDVEQFGELQLAISILGQVAITLASFQIITIILTTSRVKNAQEIIDNMERLALLAMAVLSITMILSSTILSSFFQFSSAWPFVVLALTFLVSVSMVVRRASLQAKTKFKEVSYSRAIEGVLKISLSAILVFLFNETAPALIGVLAALILAYYYTRHQAKKLGLKIDPWWQFSLPKFKVLKPHLFLLLSTVSMIAITTLFYMGDVIAIKRYFAPELAGQYAGVAVVARIIFFITISIAGVLITTVGRTKSIEQNRQALWRSLAMVVGIGGAATLLFSLASKTIINIVAGPEYTTLSEHLPLISLVVFVVSIVNLLFYYLLAFQRLIVLPISLIGGLITLVIVLSNHTTIYNVLQSLLIGTLLTLALLIAAGVYYRSIGRLYSYE